MTKQKCDSCEKRVKKCSHCNHIFDDGEMIICEKKIGNHFCDNDCFEEYYQIEETTLSEMDE